MSSKNAEKGKYIKKYEDIWTYSSFNQHFIQDMVIYFSYNAMLTFFSIAVIFWYLGAQVLLDQRFSYHVVQIS